MIGGVTRHMLPHLLWGPPPPCKQALWKNNKYAYRNVPKSVMHVQIVVSLIKPVAFLPFSLFKLPIVVIQKNFATMVTWRHTSPLYSRLHGI